MVFQEGAERKEPSTQLCDSLVRLALSTDVKSNFASISCDVDSPTTAGLRPGLVKRVYLEKASSSFTKTPQAR
jgi:hypothetical protein